MAGRKRPTHFIRYGSGDRPIIISVTAIAKNRRRCLATNAAHALFRDIWARTDYWRIGRYVIMPDHLHFFCAPENTECDLEKWMKFWEGELTKAWPTTMEKPVLQRQHWDRQLRSDESYDEKWDYYRQNPVRAGLVKDPDDWPFQGELNGLRWS